MKRFLSSILTLAMLMSMFTVFAVTSVAAVTEITNASPAITANVGEKIDLSGYSVVFDGDSTATTGITWKNDSGATIDEITPNAKGVTKLTATSGSKSKTIYLVAKNQADTEYVLYEANMSDFASIDAMKNAGWVFTDNASYYSLSDGALVMGNLNDDYVRAILPAWLGDFGDYAISTDAKMLTTVNDGRWLGVVYRIQNANGSYYPYTHMCVRENTVNSGIEFAERTSGDAWNVVIKGSGDITSLKSAYNTFKVEAKGKNIKYLINNSQVIYATESQIGTSVSSASAAYYSKGMIGLTVNYATVAFKNIKVTVQENTPVKEAKKLDLINIDHDELNLINPIANVERLAEISDLDATDAPNSVYRNANLIDDMGSYLKKCMENKILPIVYINSTDDVDKLVAGMNAVGCKDVTALATNAVHLKDIRAKKSIVRTGLIISDPTSYSTVHDLRVAVRSAPATLCVIPSSYATKELVSEIQEYAVAVWAAIPSDCENLELEAITAITAGVNGVISDDASVVTESINTHLVENAMTRTPIMIGHRGNPTQAPENTLSGFIEAYENGADVFEVDVEITKDGEIIIMHDNTLNRTTTYTGTKTVNQMTLAEVKKEYILAVNNDKSSATTERVPTLKEVCDYFQDKDCKIFVEFKGGNESNVPVTMKLLDTYGMDYLVDVISFNSNFLMQTQSNSAGMSTGYLLSSQSNGTTWEDALSSLNVYLGNVQPVNSTINPASGIVQSAGNYFTQAATDRGMTVWPWTYTYYSNDVGFFSGCDGVTTDDVQWCYNMSKFLKADDFKMVVGQTYAGGNVISEAYGNHESAISVKDTVYSVITGKENVAVVDGKLVALKEGTAEVVFGYVTATATGREYVTYTQPVTITVGAGDKTTVDNLLKLCENVSVSDYTTANIKAIRDLYNEIKATDIASLSEAKINEYIITLSNLLGNTVSETILSVGKDYERTEPNRGAGNTYNDDSVRLTDGTKGSFDGGTKAYSGWSSGVSPEITVDLGDVMKSNTYRLYACDGTWGISVPKKLTVSVSEDGKNFTTVGATTECVSMNKITDSWCTHLMTVTLDEAVSARYVKFTVGNSANHVWMDEVEVSYVTARSAAETGIYVTGINKFITSGQTSIFTPDFGEITTTNANHSWTANILAEWDEELKAYKVIEASHGIGASTPSVTLKEGQIFIASHKWDIYDTTENPFIGSKLNSDNANAVCVGDLLIPEGIDVESKSFSAIAPHFSISHTHKESTNALCIGDKTCTTCGEILDFAVPHIAGEWKTLEDGSKELRCTECDTLLGSETAPEVIPDNAKNFWVTHINDNTAEGAGVIITDSDANVLGAWAWRLVVVFKPVEGLNGVYEIAEIYNHLDLGQNAEAVINAHANSTIPAGGFIYTLNYGNDYISLGSGDTDFTSPNCNNAIEDALTWKNGDKFRFYGIDISNPAVSTSTPDVKWYDDAYICTSLYAPYVAPHVHTPGDSATCTKDQTCTDCGEIIVPKLGHKAGDAATCTKPQICTVCGDTLHYALGHKAGEWVTLEDGSQEQRCTDCGELLDSKPAPSDDPETKVYALGDIDMNGIVNQYDYILAKRAHFNTITFDENQKILGDMNEDGKNDQYDYILVKRIHFKNYSTDKTVEIVIE